MGYSSFPCRLEVLASTRSLAGLDASATGPLIGFTRLRAQETSLFVRLCVKADMFVYTAYMNGWMAGWLGGWVDGWTDGWVGGVEAKIPKLECLASKTTARLRGRARQNLLLERGGGSHFSLKSDPAESGNPRTDLMQ